MMKKKEIVLTTFALLALLFSCAKTDLSKRAEQRFEAIPSDKYYDNDPFSGENASVYGKWKVLSMYGGFAGEFFAPDFNYLLLKPNGIFAIVKNRDITITGKVDTVDQVESFGRSILRPIVDFVPDEDNRDFRLLSDNQKILHITDTTLALIAPCCDRISITLEREE